MRGTISPLKAWACLFVIHLDEKINTRISKLLTERKANRFALIQK